MRDAKETAAEWQDINTEQKMREAVAEVLEPLKDLKNLVDAETHRSIQSLSSRVGVVLNDICSAPGSLDTSLSHAAGLIEIAACHA